MYHVSQPEVRSQQKLVKFPDTLSAGRCRYLKSLFFPNLFLQMLSTRLVFAHLTRVDDEDDENDDDQDHDHGDDDVNDDDDDE